jgi:hypothetical protein
LEGRAPTGLVPLPSPPLLKQRPSLEGDDGQSIDEIIRLKGRCRTDSLVLAVEEAPARRPRARLTEAERTVLAAEGLEREVNDGGYEQLFVTSSCELVPDIVAAPKRVGCPRSATLAARAIRVLALGHDVRARAVRRVAARVSDADRSRLGDCDTRHDGLGEAVAGRLSS